MTSSATAPNEAPAAAASAQPALLEALAAVHSQPLWDRAGMWVQPGDAIVADDDGVVVVPRTRLAEVAAAAEQREAKEEATRARLAQGELGLDVYSMRDKLAAAGLRYADRAPVTDR